MLKKGRVELGLVLEVGLAAQYLRPVLHTCQRDRVVLLTSNMGGDIVMSMANMNRSDIPYGTLDLMVLKTLDTMGPLHGFGLARRIEQVAQGSLQLNQGTIYPALLRLEQKAWISSEWGTSDANRRARYYSITRAGRKQLAAETASWADTVSIVNRMLQNKS
jgi:PadR family transcriptional regulator, regulatory protein PadR